MPELPEVETIARDLASALIGQKVLKAEFLNTAIRENCYTREETDLNGKTINRISRRGKNLIFHFSENLAMVCHLKMTGRLLVDSDRSRDNKHLHFFMRLDKSDLSFYDVRKFGRICITAESELNQHPRLSKLGPEPFDITPAEFTDIVKRRSKSIKLILLDQEILAGLGNIYADESLYSAGIRPTLKPYRISRARLEILHGSIIEVLDVAIGNRGSSVDDYLDGFGQAGNFQNLIKVYGKTDQACPGCETPIKRIILGGRSTHYCMKCQK
ncbi:MAG: bifunctional DNA-formamidopyrimidine glycosylase/DNA-(apurinic or apyrimidinic site) lyase [candidate division Zixibacteria bacterium]|nr:bifunctional DNA-formamidopyrimidine glycosylase/DNA-(apurinic or apyrimidinic site) lyase [candidate division Zixibacteria bacterium]